MAMSNYFFFLAYSIGASFMGLIVFSAIQPILPALSIEQNYQYHYTILGSGPEGDDVL